MVTRQLRDGEQGARLGRRTQEALVGNALLVEGDDIGDGGPRVEQGDRGVIESPGAEPERLAVGGVCAHELGQHLGQELLAITGVVR